MAHKPTVSFIPYDEAVGMLRLGTLRRWWLFGLSLLLLARMPPSTLAAYDAKLDPWQRAGTVKTRVGG